MPKVMGKSMAVVFEELSPGILPATSPMTTPTIRRRNVLAAKRRDAPFDMDENMSDIPLS
jgi:hypothetical protein